VQEAIVRAIRVNEFGGPEVLKLEELPDPQPGPGQLVVEIRVAGVNPVDAYIRTGTYASKPNLPYTPGNDAAGVVGAVGAEVKRFKAGDRVYISGSKTGAYAEKALCDESTVQPLPEQANFEQGAAIGVPYATAYRGVFLRGQVKPAETVLVHGATGGVGIAAVQLARAIGVTVIGTAGSPEGKKLVKEQGVHHVLDHSSDAHYEDLMKLTEGRGVDVIIEMLANKNLANDLTVLAKHGRVVVIGNRGTIEINPRDAMGRDADIRATTLMNTTPEEYRLIHAALGAGLENGTLKPVIGERFPLAEAARAHEAIMKASGALGKIVLIP
jgi:NADPH2:quinone reductase